MRLLLLTHRYLGIGVGLLMLTWCLSGIVMMYVPYPSLEQQSRIRALAALELRNCCAALGSSTLTDATPVEEVRIEMLGGVAIAQVRRVFALDYIDLKTGAALPPVSLDLATKVADAYVEHLGLPGGSATSRVVDDDQWTIAEEFTPDRPLYQFTWSDAQRSTLYVSSTSGRAVQFTDSRIRFWNWLGAIPHWVYFTALRRQPAVWSQVIIVTSGLGGVLTALGMYIGVRQYWRCAPGQMSPYRGHLLWHHFPGLIFGLFAFTWVLSGLLSMNPWGLLEGEGPGAERTSLRGTAMNWGMVRLALARIGQQPNLQSMTLLRTAPLGGKLFLVATFPDGTRRRLDADGVPSPLSAGELAAAASHIRSTDSGGLMSLSHDDAFYYSRPGNSASLPVYRLIGNDAGHTRYYFDPVSGEIVAKADSGARAYRWWHDALHTLDFSAALRSRPAWDIVMLFLLAGTSVLAATGCYAAIKRLTRRAAR